MGSTFTQKIVPAIIPESLEHLRMALERIRPFSREVQIDIVDGTFVPFTSWPYGSCGDVADITQYTSNIAVEVDLMVERPEDVVETYLMAGAGRVVIHLESTSRLPHIAALKKDYTFELGLSILNTTDLAMLEAAVAAADYVQLMGIGDIGSQGQPFDERVLARIGELKLRHPKLQVSIDGSVNESTLPRLRNAGADRFVSGSAIIRAENPEVSFTHLTELATNSTL